MSASVWDSGGARPFHSYSIQAVTFLLAGYVFLSWDFAAIAYIPDEAMGRPTRELLYVYWKTPWYYVTSGQFLYRWIARPGPATISLLQWALAGCAALGLLGVLPRAMAIGCLAIGTHLMGMFLAANSTLDASSTALLFLVFLVATAPQAALYTWRRGGPPGGPSAVHHWPRVTLLIFLSAYYFTAGVNKVLDIGVDWPNRLRLDRFSVAALDKAIFLSSWYTSVPTSRVLSIYVVALAFAWSTFLIELLCPLAILRPRLITPLFVGLALMHVGIFLSHGYGYFTNAAADLLCAACWFGLQRDRQGAGVTPEPSHATVAHQPRSGERM